jgi:hypothetical protein
LLYKLLLFFSASSEERRGKNKETNSLQRSMAFQLGALRKKQEHKKK